MASGAIVIQALPAPGPRSMADISRGDFATVLAIDANEATAGDRSRSTAHMSPGVRTRLGPSSAMARSWSVCTGSALRETIVAKDVRATRARMPAMDEHSTPTDGSAPAA